MKLVRESEEASSSKVFYEVPGIPASQPTLDSSTEVNPEWIQYEDEFRLARSEMRRRNVGKMQR